MSSKKRSPEINEFDNKLTAKIKVSKNILV